MRIVVGLWHGGFAAKCHKLLVLGSYGDMTGGTETVLNLVVPRLKKNFDEVLVVAPRKRRRFFRRAHAKVR